MPRAAKAAAASGVSSAFGALPFAICAITDPCRVLRLSCASSYTLKHLAQRIAPAAAFVHASALQAASSGIVAERYACSLGNRIKDYRFGVSEYPSNAADVYHPDATCFLQSCSFCGLLGFTAALADRASGEAK